MNSQETGIKYFHEKVFLSNDSFGSDNLQVTGDTLVEGTATDAIHFRIQKWNYHFLLYIIDVPVHTMKVHDKMEAVLHSFLTSSLDGDEQLAS